MNNIQLCSTQGPRLKGLYQTLSEYAGANNLIISKIEKKQIEQVTKAAAMAKAAGKKAKTI